LDEKRQKIQSKTALSIVAKRVLLTLIYHITILIYDQFLTVLRGFFNRATVVLQTNFLGFSR
jgi:hypothetical protein